MECTNCGDECSFVKSGFCKIDKECPFFVESWWQLDGQPQPKLIKDCFPKKFIAEQNNLLHRFLVTQSVLEELRNRIDILEKLLKQLINQGQDFLTEQYYLKLKNEEKLALLNEKDGIKSIE